MGFELSRCAHAAAGATGLGVTVDFRLIPCGRRHYRLDVCLSLQRIHLRRFCRNGHAFRLKATRAIPTSRFLIASETPSGPAL